MNGEKVLLSTPRRAADAGVLYIPNDRQREGLFLGQAVERNLTVTRLRRLSRLGVLLRRRIQRTARELATLAAVPVDRLGSPAGSLSGGNQQKVLLGRALQLEGTALLALDEPTRGVDVGGRAEIHNLVRETARKGTAVIFSSTELDEVLDLADVVVTIFAGRIVSVVPRVGGVGLCDPRGHDHQPERTERSRRRDRHRRGSLPPGAPIARGSPTSRSRSGSRCWRP